MTYSTEFSTELKHLLQQIQKHICQLEEAFSAPNPGQGSPEEMSPEPQLQRDSGQGDFRGYCTRAVIPVWQPVVNCACSRDTYNSRDAHNWSFNYLPINSIQTQQTLKCSAWEKTHPPFCLLCNINPSPSSRVRPTGQETSGKKLNFFCIKHQSEVLTQAVNTGMLSSRPLDRDSR